MTLAAPLRVFRDFNACVSRLSKLANIVAKTFVSLGWLNKCKKCFAAYVAKLENMCRKQTTTKRQKRSDPGKSYVAKSFLAG